MGPPFRDSCSPSAWAPTLPEVNDRARPGSRERRRSAGWLRYFTLASSVVQFRTNVSGIDAAWARSRAPRRGIKARMIATHLRICPPRLPMPRRGHGFAERNVPDEVFQRVERCTVANHEHRPARECRRGLGEPRRYTSDNLLIALTVGEWSRNMKDTLLLNLQRGTPRESPVIALTEPCITDNWQNAIAKGDLGRYERNVSDLNRTRLQGHLHGDARRAGELVLHLLLTGQRRTNLRRDRLHCQGW